MLNCGLLGRKLAHSYSPAIHEAFGGGYRYMLFEVEPPDLAAFLAREDLHGLNVTIPYKQEVLAFCRELSPAAAEIGSVNTLLRTAAGFFGDNTDAAGFRKMVKQSALVIRGRKVIVFGKGGSSLSVCHVLKELGAAEIVIVSRKDNNAEFLRLHGDAAVLINTTPVGMYPGTEDTPVSLEHFPALEGVCDIIYNPARTRLMMEAEDRGLPVMGGLSMLVGQAAAASEIFTGKKIDAAKEREVTRILRRRMENIILVGMPGCGKTTIGRMLAERLGKRFVDTDAEIAHTAGCSIPEIFGREGEAGFRERETETLKKLGKESGLVLATGGGCVTREENYRPLRQNGSIVFIERSVNELARNDRPLSQGDLDAMYEQRLPHYRRFAGGLVVQNQGEVPAVVEKITEALDEIAGN